MFGLKTGRISPLFKGMNGKLPSLAIIFFILIDVFVASFLLILVFDIRIVKMIRRILYMAGCHNRP